MTGTVFRILIIAIVYIIIFYALRLIYKDIKNGDKKKITKKSLGLEITDPGENKSLKKGGIIPIQREVTFGRKEDNALVMVDPYVSGHHAKIFLKNTEYILEDMGSTNGTLLNGVKLLERTVIKSGDEIKIGSAVFKVI